MGFIHPVVNHDHRVVSHCGVLNPQQFLGVVVGVGAAGEGELGWGDPLNRSAATQRQVQALTAQLFTLTTSKVAPRGRTAHEQARTLT